MESPTFASGRMNKRQYPKSPLVGSPYPKSPQFGSPFPKSPVSTLAWKAAQEHQGRFTRPIAVCFALNYVVGTGFLVLPYVFVQAGLILSVATVIVASVVADMAKDFVLVSMARAEYVVENGLIANGTAPQTEATDRESNGFLQEETSLTSCSNGTKGVQYGYGRSQSLHATEGSTRACALDKSDEYNSPASALIEGALCSKSVRNQPLIVKDRTIELSSLSDIFMGKSGLVIYTVLLSIYMYMMLWAYVSVFAQAMAISAPILADSSHDYTIYAIIFGSIVIPISFIEIEDQILIQITLTIFRAARLLLMIETSLHCPECFDRDIADSPRMPMCRIEGFHILLPIVVAANLMHEAIPDLSHPVKDKDNLGKTFMWTFICTGVIYSLLGWSVGHCFGNNVEPSSNLNWIAFHSPNGRYEWMFSAISYFVVCSPTLDVISAYPLNAIALGNNLIEVRCGSVRDVEANHSTRMLFRILAAVPPVIGALFVRDLGVITDYAGVAGLAMTFCVTSAMYIRSGTFSKLSSVPTFYDSYGTSVKWAYTVFWFGVGLVLLILFELITEQDDI